MKLICRALFLALLLEFISPYIPVSHTDTGYITVEERSDEILNEDFTPKRGINSPINDKQTQNTSDESIPAMAENFDTVPQSWYCMRTEGGKRPSVPPEMAYVSDHDGFFLGKDEKVIYLTFDAGYENGNIEKILDTLKAENVEGAFFILENLVKQNTDLVKRMAEEGHTVCNHTAKHRDMTTVQDIEEFKSELEAMESCFRDITGYEMAKYYRPPEGKMNEQNLAWAEELGYKTILWSFAYADWDNNKQMNTDKAIEKVMSGTHNGEVILLHPTSATNAEILPILIQKWKAMGYRFGTLDELTGESE